MGTKTVSSSAPVKQADSRVDSAYVRWFDTLMVSDVPVVGGKNASLGEMIQTLKSEGIRVPDGFATTADAYRQFLEENQLVEPIKQHLSDMKSGKSSLEETGRGIRRLFLNSRFPEPIAKSIRQAYRELSDRYSKSEVDVAARSSATAEDLPEASFAGQQETFLNISGEQSLLEACRNCYASLFTDRAISYREKNGFDHMKVALSVGVQKMVRSDLAGAGVMFSIDTESGFPNAVLINAAWGLGESVVQGIVSPDEYLVFKPLLDDTRLEPIIGKELGEKAVKIIYAKGGTKTIQTLDTSPEERDKYVLTDGEIIGLARWARIIEDHYGRPMDMEWAKDGETGDMYIVQARPETVQSQKAEGTFRQYKLKEKGEVLLTGLSVGEAIASGTACIIESTEDIGKFKEGSILVTQMTEPDWVPIIRKAAAIITNTGGRTSHAAIVSREYGIPAIIGTGNATETLKDGQSITISCAEGSEGYVYEGLLDFDAKDISLENIPHTKTQIMMNIASPGGAFQWWRLPADGIGLARMEFIINNIIRIHPMALIHPNRVKDRNAQRQIEELTEGYADKTDYFVEHLAQGIAKIAASQFPNPVIVRTSDFKTNEYASLIGGTDFEPHESNPMIGFRGASRYYSDAYREGFSLECQALKRARETMGFTNIVIMIPFCRTLEEAQQVLEIMERNGLKRGKNDLQVYMMSEIPSNVVLAKEFARYFDGFSIGSNDLTQLVLGVDRDSMELAYLFDERNEAVKRMIEQLIRDSHEEGIKVGICGQGPSDHPDFAEFLVRCGIDSISLNPDSIVNVKKRIATLESESLQPRR